MLPGAHEKLRGAQEKLLGAREKLLGAQEKLLGVQEKLFSEWGCKKSCLGAQQKMGPKTCADSISNNVFEATLWQSPVPGSDHLDHTT